MSETFSAQVKRKAKYIDKIQWTKTLKRKNLTKKIKKQWQFFYLSTQFVIVRYENKKMDNKKNNIQ